MNILAMLRRSSKTTAGGVDSPQTNSPLTDLEEAVLIHICARLEDPQPLASTCKALHAVSTSSACRQLWFQRWHARHPLASRRPLPLAALSWHGLAWTEEPSASAQKQQQEPPPLVALLCSTACHYLQPEQQQLAAQQLAYQLPSGVSNAEISHALHSTDQQQQLKIIQQLTPWHEHLLLPAAAAAGNYTLLQQLLAEYSPAAAAAPNSAAGSSSHACAGSSANASSSGARCAGMGASSSRVLQDGGPSASTSSACRAGMGAGSSSALQDGAQRLQQWLWQPSDPAPAGQGGQDAPQARWGKFLQPLPDFPGLKSFEHNVLLTSLTAAAKGGSAKCLQLLSGELASCHAGPLVCAEALTTVAEAAAAAGSLECFQIVRRVLRLPQEQIDDEINEALDMLALRMAIDARRNGQEQLPAGGPLPTQLLLQPQGLGVLQPDGPCAGVTALKWVEASNFLLVAAAKSGCCRVLTSVMELMQVRLLSFAWFSALSWCGFESY